MNDIAQPQLFVFAGRPGAGKSTLADMLGEKYGFVRVDKDDSTFKTNDIIRERHKAHEGTGIDFWETPECKKILEPALYREVFERAYGLLREGKNCVVDGPLLKEAEDPNYPAFIDSIVRANGLNTKVTFFWFTLSADALKRNIFTRDAERDYAKMRDWDSYIAGIDFNFRPVFAYNLVDTSSQTPQELFAYIESIAHPRGSTTNPLSSAKGYEP